MSGKTASTRQVHFVMPHNPNIYCHKLPTNDSIPKIKKKIHNNKGLDSRIPCQQEVLCPASSERRLHQHRPALLPLIMVSFIMTITCRRCCCKLIRNWMLIYLTAMRPSLWIWWNSLLGKQLYAFLCKLAFCSHINGVLVRFEQVEIAKWATLLQNLMCNGWNSWPQCCTSSLILCKKSASLLLHNNSHSQTRFPL